LIENENVDELKSLLSTFVTLASDFDSFLSFEQSTF